MVARPGKKTKAAKPGKAGKGGAAAGGAKGKAAGSRKYILDCTALVSDKVIDAKRMETFFRDRFKVQHKVGQLEKAGVKLSSDRNRVILETEHQFQKRYIKYLAKKYLKKQQIRDYVKVISITNKKDQEKEGFELRYYRIDAPAAAE
eukprot:Selendium_serpulae@DN4453_c0_g1_i1.p1